MPEIGNIINVSTQIGFNTGLAAGLAFFFANWGVATVLKILNNI